MKRLIVGWAAVAAVLGIAGPVSAADMVVKARPGAASDPCGVARFTGLYAGGNVGATAYTSSREDLDGMFTDNSGWTARTVAASAGLQAGYDWQSCHKVFGVVADWNWTDARTKVLDEPNDGFDVNQGHQSRMHWFATVRARGGLAVNDTLFYVTGGVAAAKIKTTLTEIDVGNRDQFIFDKTRWGLTAGVGAEFALWNNWSLNTELLYLHFKKETVTTAVSPTQGGPFAFDLNDSAWVGRIGLNYRWDNPRNAYAASFPVKGADPVFPCGPARFNGGYVGGNVGAVSYTADRSDLDGLLTDNGGWSATKTAVAAGVQAGWDWQSCNKLLGVVADWNWTNAKAITREEPNDPTDIDQSFTSKMDWFSTLRARAGLVVDDALIYVTGGVAAARIKTTIAEVDTVNNDRITFEKTRLGFAGGVGAEFALSGNWSVSTELLYMQFKRQSVTIARTPTQIGPFNFDFNDSAFVSRVGLNYRWDNPRDAYAAATPVKGAAYPCGPARFNGFYAGGNVGGTAYTAKRSDLDGYLVDNSGWTATKTAAAAGVQAGYDWQFCHKVFGVVADWNWTDAEAITPSNPNAIGTTSSIKSKMDWFSTLRTRSGLVVDDTLVYVTGGLAAARIHTTYSEAITGAFNESFTFDKTRWGWTGGFGAEFALASGWSANAEVLYMQLRKDTVTLNSPPANNGVSNFDQNDSAWVGRVGLNYRWGGAGKGPVVAKF